MSEMCSVCIIRAQRDDDDFLPCSASCFRAAIAEAREDEGQRYDRMAVVHWDAGHAHGLWDAELTSKKQSLRKGLWIGWAIGTLLMVIPLLVLAVTQ
jgi:hypothetical protein